MKIFSAVELTDHSHVFPKVNAILKKIVYFENYFSNTCPHELRPHFGKGFSWHIRAIYWYPDHICMYPQDWDISTVWFSSLLKQILLSLFFSMNIFVKAFPVWFFSFSYFLHKRVVKNNKVCQWNKWQSKNVVENKHKNTYLLPFSLSAKNWKNSKCIKIFLWCQWKFSEEKERKNNKYNIMSPSGIRAESWSPWA